MRIRSSDLNGDLSKLIFEACKDEPKKSDIALVLGSAPESAKNRAEYAVEYFFSGYTEKILVSGGNFHDFGGKKARESDILEKELLNRGVPSRAIIKESRAKSTMGNMVFSLAEFCERGILDGDFKSLTVITEPFHMLRSLLLARTYFPKFGEVYGYTKNFEAREREFLRGGEIEKTVNGEISMIRELIKSGKIIL